MPSWLLCLGRALFRGGKGSCFSNWAVPFGILDAAMGGPEAYGVRERVEAVV